MIVITVIKADKPCPKCERTLAIASEIAGIHPGLVEVRTVQASSREADAFGVVMPPALFAADIPVSNGRIPRKADVQEAVRIALAAAASEPGASPPSPPRQDEGLVDVCAEEFDESQCEAMLLFWHFEEGKAVRKGDELAEVETAKAVFVIEAPADGILSRILVREGDAVGSGQRLATIATRTRGESS
jgi:biotin carboxyl carrier protein